MEARQKQLIESETKLVDKVGTLFCMPIKACSDFFLHASCFTIAGG